MQYRGHDTTRRTIVRPPRGLYYAVGYDDTGRVVEVSQYFKHLKDADHYSWEMYSNSRIASIKLLRTKVRGNPETVATATVGTAPATASAPATVPNPCGSRRRNPVEYEFDIEGYYRGYGWEILTTEETRSEAMQRLREYNANEFNVPHRIVRRRVKP